MTGNGGAIYVEPAQPGRAIMDPDADILADDAQYPLRIAHEDISASEIGRASCRERV